MSISRANDDSKPRVNWVRTGPENTSTVVLIHPVGFDLTYWDRQIEALQPDYSVVAFDLPGHGRSSGEPQDWSFEYAARTVAGLIETVGAGPVHLAGISFGGMIAQATVLARPDLIRSLTLIGTASAFPDPVRAAMRSRAEAVRTGGMAAVLQSSLERWFTPETTRRRPDLIDRVTKTVLSDDPAIHAAIWDIIADFNVSERLGEIRCPTLVLVGELDPSTPPSSASALVEGIPNSRMVVLPNTSHIVMLEAPEAVNAEIKRFLSEN